MPHTDKQLVLLHAASQRNDRLLPRPDKLAGAALTKIEASLTSTGLAEPVPVRSDQPAWRDHDGTPLGLRITSSGLVAIGSETPPMGDHGPVNVLPSAANQTGPGRRQPVRSEPTTVRAFRTGSKGAQLVVMLSDADGTSIVALATALSWQPHTVRAALTRLRQRGFTITTMKDAQNSTRYRIARSPGVGAAPVNADETV